MVMQEQASSRAKGRKHEQILDAQKLQNMAKKEEKASARDQLKNHL